MSTLSELIPSGGTQNNIEFVAQGTLANGQTVALRSDGKVEAVGESAIAENMGAIAEYATGTVGYLSVAFNVADGKYVFAYIDFAASGKLYAVVGTPSGTDITFGTPLEISGAGSYGYLQAVYDASAQKVVLGSNYSTGYFQIVVLTISGTNLTKGTAATPYSSPSSYVCGVYHEAEQKCVFINMFSSLNNTMVHVATVSGTSVTINSSTAVPSETTIHYLSATYVNTTTPRVLFIGKSTSNSNYTRGFTFTVSGTTPTFNSNSANLDTNTNAGSSCVYNSQAERGIGFFVVGNTVYGISIEMNGSGDLVSLGTKKTISSGSPNYNLTNNSSVYDPLGYLTYVTYYSGGITNRLQLQKISYSSNTLTIEGESAISTSGTEVGIGYDSTNKQIGVSFKNGNDGDDGYGRVYTIAGTSTNVSSYIGITNAAISSGATGEVAVKGGLSTGGNLLPYAPTAGSPVTYESGFAVTKSVSYDTNANKAVIANRRGSDNYGIVYVGTVSGTSISFGSVAVFNAGTTEYISSAFDSNANKVVIAYTDSSNSGYGTAIVGTVSGTSITFGTEAVFEAAAVNGKSIVFDSTSNKVVIFYEDDANNDYGTAVVGTVSGTSISFGTPVVFDSVNMQITDSGEGAAYDSANNRAVIFYRNSNYEGYAAVGTVSGTSISFGTPVKFSSGAAEIDYISAAFDSAANKIVTSYTVNTDSGYSKAIVGTVSGTSISFGSEATFESADSGYTSATFNSTINKVVISYSDFANSNYGTLVISTISGTSISFTTPAVFTSTTAARYISTAFDPDTGSVISGFSDQNNSYYAKSVVTSFSNALTIGSNYFVQDDGTLATTSSSNKAGKAISTTALNLVDPT